MFLRNAKSNIILSRSDGWFFNVSTIGLIYCSTSTLVQPQLDIALTLDSILQQILIFQYDSWLTLNLLSCTLPMQYKIRKQKKNMKQCVLS